MANPLVDERDVKFVLFEQLDIEQLSKTTKYAEHSRDMYEMVLEQAWKLAENEFSPANRTGDEEGCAWKDGRVKVPESYHRPYKMYKEGGWLSIADDVEAGGQGFPVSIGLATTEAFGAANWSLIMFPGLTHGAARLVELFGTDEQRRSYMDMLYAGEWCGTMCLTEPQAGTDVGALRTKATRNNDGTYSISGTKIFISCGEHDLSENIVHMVLARVEGAPQGTKGISIFIVPKLRQENGSLVDNDVVCGGIEKKLGIHGSPTCVLNFGENDNCIGYLLGQENQGMRIMFQMMNEARLFVGMQGLCHASAAYMQALHFAKERIQGAEVSRMRDPSAPKVAIIKHPNVRRMLMFMKSVCEGLRALLYYTGFCEDMVRCSESDEEREKYQDFIDILIPVCKAYGSDLGFRICEAAVQVHGGYGYCQEYPVEQHLRDCKIASIYEGTNGIQALDLVGRKLVIKRGRLFKRLIAETEDFLKWARKNFELRELVATFEASREQLIQVTKYFGLKGMTEDYVETLLYASPYLELFGDVALGFMLLWQALIAQRRLQEIYLDAGAKDVKSQNELLASNRSAAFYRGKVASAEFFITNVLSLAKGKAKAIMSGQRAAVDIPEEAFALA
ncbi:MAG: acyl-CoA dehydrogenase [Deltaproteobacteria bacterium]|nr:MAG: acyl-CoA dehydrogenase [Deltaproteobacteria bacterium]